MSILSVRLAHAVAAVSAATIVAQGCAALKSSSDRAPEAGPVADDASRCASRQPPPRPNVAPSGGSLDLKFAVSSSYFGLWSYDDAGRPAYESLGFDLDHACTGEGQGPSCAVPDASADYHDQNDGIDNAAGLFFARLTGFMRPAGLNDPADASGTVANQIFRVRGYSGEPDDDQVDVAVYAGIPVGAEDDGGVALRWDGTDRWNVLAETLLALDGGAANYDMDQPRYQDDHAYVSKGVLVARLPQVLWPTGLAVAPRSLAPDTGLVLAGTLVHDADGQWELQNLVTGLRAPVGVFLSIVARAPSPDGTLYCRSPFFDSLRHSVCTAVDIASSETSAPSSPCDAVSGGSLFQAKQVVLSGVDTKIDPLPACPQGVDPATCAPATADAGP